MKPFLTLLAIAALAGCATAPSRPTARQINSDSYATIYLGSDGRTITKTTPAGKVQSKGEWHGDGMTGSPSIVINLTEQEVYFYKGGKLAGRSPISSGKEGYRTPTGSYSIIQKNIDHVSNLYGNYVDDSGNIVVRNVGVLEDPRPPGTRFAGAPMPYFMRITGGVGMHQGFLPGVADSHGCIRLPREMAQIFYENTPLGTPVRITH